MDYPFFDIPRLGGGMLIAVVAIVHVVIAHFAVGAGLYNAITETIAVRRGDAVKLAFIRRNSKFLVLFAFVAGAITGVGIWFSIGLVAPKATGILIRNFVWGWATEWVFFFIEIVSGYIYYASWGRMDARRHVALAWIYAAAAWLSLVVINGILTYMITAPQWRVHEFWWAFADGNFWASLLARTVSGLAFAGLFALIVVNLQRSRVVAGSAEPDRDGIAARYDDAWYAGAFDRTQRTQIVRYSAWYLVPIVLMLPAAVWWFESLPAEFRDLVFGGAIAMTLFFIFGIVASLFITLYAYFGMIRGGLTVNLHTACMLASLAVVATGSMEFVREGIRKPYVIAGVIYSNGITPAEGRQIDRDGFFARDENGAYRFAGFVGWRNDVSKMTPAQRGRLIYEGQCAACHVDGGSNDMGPLIDRWSPELMDFTFARLHELKGYMPPLFGTDRDRADLVAYCVEHFRGRGAW